MPNTAEETESLLAASRRLREELIRVAARLDTFSEELERETARLQILQEPEEGHAANE